jgi:Putative auto-transporter adhesin, head GIN domain
MRLLPTLLPTLFFALFATTAAAEEQEWVLRIKKEAQQLAISVGGSTSYGSSANRIKGSGLKVEKARSVAAFSRVRLDGPVDAQLTPATEPGLRVQADDNLEPLVETRVDGDTLVIGIKDGSSFSTRNPLRVLVGFKSLESLQLRGSGDATLDRLKGERLALELSGSGDLRVGLLELRELTARLSGSGDVRAAGRADQQDWELSGSGDVDADSLSGQRVRARLSGSGDLSLGVAQELDASLSGSGDLRYAGRPQLKSRVSGSGELIQR